MRIGTDLVVSRGDPDAGMDVSDMCTVTSLQPECVRYVPETRSLVGVAPGQSQVAIALGDKIVNVAVEVVTGRSRGKAAGRAMSASSRPAASSPAASRRRCGSTWA